MLLALLATASVASAQMFEDLDQPRPEPEPIAPTAPPETEQPVPGLTGGLDWLQRVRGEELDVPRPSLVPEGSFLIRRPGRVVELPTGHRVWVPLAGTRRAGEGPMLLVPCLTLSRLETSIQSAPDEPVLISGEVFVYHGRNYLLPTAFGRVTEARAEPGETPDPTDAAGEPGDDTPADPPASESLPDNPDVDELMRALDESVADRGLTLPSRDTGAGVDGAAQGGGRAYAPSPGLVPEGTYLTRQSARLIRDASGAWTVAFDNDPDSASVSEPMTVVPCRLLQQLEPRAQRRGDQLSLTVSGRVYTHGERNYLVPTLMQEIEPTGIDPRQ